MRRRTKAQYARLFDDPTRLFPNVETILFPNGKPEIWFKARDGRLSICLEVSVGPYGMGINMRRHVGTEPITVFHGTNAYSDLEYAELCQYLPHPTSQRFKEHYAAGTLDDFDREEKAHNEASIDQ